MNYTQLTDLQKREIISYYTSNVEIHSDVRQEVLAQKYNVTKRTIRNWLSNLNVTQSTFEKELSEHPQYLKALERRLPKSKYYIVTWEQNKTPVHDRLWRNILAYRDFLEGELVVIQGRYQNPTSIWKDKISNEGWSTLTEDFQYTSRLQLHPFLDVIGEAKVRPTAVNPLTGFEALTGLNTGIVGHPKLHLETAKMPKAYRKKILATTGAITLPNYTESKSGIQGESKHKLGFTVVEIRDDEVFYIRQVEADEWGNFYDLFFHIKDGKVSRNEDLLAIVFGDTHFPYTDSNVLDCNDELLELFNVGKLVWHDVIDAQSVNRHIADDPIARYKRFKSGQSNIHKDFMHTMEFLKEYEDYDNYIVRSNHEKWAEEYIKKQDWKKDIENAPVYMDMAKALLSGEANEGVLPWYIKNNLKGFTCLTEDSSLRIGKYECGQHGDLGANGSRGSISQFSKIDIPTITGHTHTTQRKDDTINVGTNTKYDMGYNKGPSNWLQSDVIIHPNGVAQQIIFIEGNYTTLKDKL